MELEKLIRDAGITGAGGAGFPSYAKLKEGLDTLLINAAECEPLLYTDYTILKYDRDILLSGAAELLSYKDIRRALLCIKEHNAKPLGLSDGDELIPGLRVKLLPDVYPIGDEVSLIYEATGRVMKPGNLPSSLGIVVFNAETVYNVGLAKRGIPVIKKRVTVGGDIGATHVVTVPVGAPVSEVFAKLGIEVPEGYAVIDGGPSMGKIIDPETASVTKTTKGLLILPRGIAAVDGKFINTKMSVARAETACCQCTRCTDMCPRGLLGYPLEPHKMVRTAMGAAELMPETVIAATLCCSCGICETVACSQGISPKAVISEYKALLSKNKMRYISAEEPHPEREREYRMLPSKRWAEALGVARFDKVPARPTELTGFSRVEIPLRSNIGLPATPTVSEGEKVNTGAVIADAAMGLSIPQHASISGSVSLRDGRIIIYKE